MSMRTSGNIGEHLRIDSETFNLTSAAAATSKPVSLEDYNKLCFVVGMGTAAANLNPAITVQQSSDSTGARTTVASTTIGSTSATRVDNARSAVVTMGTAATLTQRVVVNGTTFTFTTSMTATSGEFGSTVGATAAEGLASAMHSLATLINGTNGISGITATTQTTAAVLLEVDDTAATSLNLSATGGGFTVAYDSAQAIVEIDASDLSTGQKYVSLKVSTVATSVDIAISSVRSGRHKPAIVQGTYKKSS